MLQNETLTGTIFIAGGSEPVLETATVKSTNVEQTITPEEGVDGFSSVTVEALELQNKTITPTTSQQTITADTGYDALGTVTVDASSGGTDTLDDLFNTYGTPVDFTMTDEGDHICYGFRTGFNVTLPSTVTAIDGLSFCGLGMQTGLAGGLKSISGAGVLSVGSSAFSMCGGLQTVDLPAVISLGSSAFSYTTLTSLRFPNLQSIGSECFAYADQLTNLYIGYDGVCALGFNAFATWGSRKVTVHVPSAHLSNYEADSDWASAVSSGKCELVGDYA